MTDADFDEDWYRKPDEKIRPGDIFQLTPSFRALKDLKFTGRRQQMKDGEFAQVVDRATVSAKIAEGRQDGEILVNGRLAYGILLTRGCEVENGRYRQLAVIRAMTDLQGDKSRSAEQLQVDLIEGRMYALHYLPGVPPEFGSVFGDSYVDFRFICTLDRNLLDTLKRPLSLTRTAVHQLYFGWMRHATGVIPKSGPCPKCHEMIPLLLHQEGLLAPPDDW